MLMAKVDKSQRIHTINLSNHKITRDVNGKALSYTLGDHLPVTESATATASASASASAAAADPVDSDEFEIIDGDTSPPEAPSYNAYQFNHHEKRFVVFDPAKDDPRTGERTGRGAMGQPFVGDVLDAYRAQCELNDSDVILIPLIQCRGFFNTQFQRAHFVMVLIHAGNYFVIDSQGALKAFVYPDINKDVAKANAFSYQVGIFKNYIAFNQQQDHDSCGVFVLETLAHILTGDIDITLPKAELEASCQRHLTQKAIEQSPYRPI